MSERVQESGLQVAKSIHELVNQSILPGTGLTTEAFWPKFAAIVGTERILVVSNSLTTKHSFKISVIWCLPVTISR
jgi:malate synthase